MGVWSASGCIWEMSIILYTGKPGNGKSLKMADTVLGLLARNWRYAKQTGVVRKVMSNMTFSKQLEAEYPGFIGYWERLEELTELRGADIVIDEVANLLDARHWANLPVSVPVFLRQHEKRGCDIYATTQNFPNVEVSFRRLVTELYECTKWFGSDRPGPCKPLPKRIWGLIGLTHYDPDTYDSPKPKRTGLSWGFTFPLWMSRRLVDSYDTLQEIKQGVFPPLQHIERRCVVPGCPVHLTPKVVHM